jgi:CubicO group peptidase (beta-lactamase class C family)
MTRTYFAAWALALAAAFPSAAHGLDLQAKIDPLARPLLEEGLAVGFVVCILKDKEMQILPYGETARGSGVAPNGDTVYEIGSISKVFTGILLADAVLRGRMKLGDTLQQRLPPYAKAPVAGGVPISLEHLATHTSGLPRLPDNLSPADPANPYAEYDSTRMYAFLAGHKLRRPPGQFEYSNFGMGVLGHVVALDAGMTYEQLMIERIAAPLGMGDTRMVLDERLRRRLAAPYDWELQAAKNWDIPTLAGAGALRSTCKDLLRFMQANLAHGEQPLNRALRLAQEPRHAIGNGRAIGLGWLIGRDGVTRWHNGMTGGYHAWVAVVPGRDVGVALLANTASMRFTSLGEQITRVALGLEVTPIHARKAIEVAPATLASYAGSYLLRPGFVLTVTVEDGKLMVHATNQAKYQVFAESSTRFFYKVVDAQISFLPDSNGTVGKLILHQDGRDREAVRQR